MCTTVMRSGASLPQTTDSLNFAATLFLKTACISLCRYAYQTWLHDNVEEVWVCQVNLTFFINSDLKSYSKYILLQHQTTFVLARQASSFASYFVTWTNGWLWDTEKEVKI